MKLKINSFLFLIILNDPCFASGLPSDGAGNIYLLYLVLLLVGFAVFFLAPIFLLTKARKLVKTGKIGKQKLLLLIVLAGVLGIFGFIVLLALVSGFSYSDEFKYSNDPNQGSSISYKSADEALTALREKRSALFSGSDQDKPQDKPR